jgi:hypothetical protein
MLCKKGTPASSLTGEMKEKMNSGAKIALFCSFYKGALIFQLR